MSVVVNKVSNCVSDDVFERTVNKIDKRNEQLRNIYGNEPYFNERYYYITTSGIKRNYFTLWRYYHTGVKGLNGGYIIHNKFVQNISLDFEKAVDKVLEKVGNSKMLIQIMDTDNVLYKYDPREFIMQFGKYKGEDITDIAEKDIKYLMWVVDNLQPKSKLNEKVFENIRTQIDVYFDNIRKHNEETCKSEFVGNEKDRLTDFSLTITKVRNIREGNEILSKEITFTDDNENLFVTYAGKETKNFNFNYQEGMKVVLSKATIANHYVKLGRKFTRLVRVGFVA